MAWKRRDLSEENRLVYFIQCGGECGPIKIGTAAKPMERLVSLQVGCPYELTLIGVVDGGPLLEEQIQSEFRDLAFRGEWFNFSPHLAQRIVEITGKPVDVVEALREAANCLTLA